MLCAFDSHDFVRIEYNVLCRKCGAVWEPPTSKHGPLIIPATVQTAATDIIAKDLRDLERSGTVA